MLDKGPSIARQVEGVFQENQWSWLAITTKTKLSRESATGIPKDLAMSETPDVKKNTGIIVGWRTLLDCERCGTRTALTHGQPPHVA